VLAEIATGLSLKVVASNLSISVQAVSTYLRRAKTKLGSCSRSDLLAAMAGEAVGSDLARTIPDHATRAERTICEAIIEGRSYRSIATARGTSVRTVQHQARSLFEKFGVNSRGELAALIFRSSARPAPGALSGSSA
jgi:DNA-binding CsgD family transcriptional regulator